MSRPLTFPRLSFLRRVCATGAMALVLVLATLAASPELHRALHGDHVLPSDDGCAVVQFVQGISTAPDTAVVVARVSFLASDPPQQVDAIRCVAPRYLHQPERGPPAA